MMSRRQPPMVSRMIRHDAFATFRLSGRALAPSLLALVLAASRVGLLSAAKAYPL